MFFKDFATLPKLKTMLVKELGKHGYTIRHNENSFIVSNDRADLMTINFKIFRRSFDIWTTDAFGVQNALIKTYRGNDWRRFMKREIQSIIETLNMTWVKDGYVINTKWQEMMREIYFPDYACT